MEIIDKKENINHVVTTTIDHPLSQLSEKAWEIGKKRHQVLEPLLKLSEIPKSKIQEVCKELGLSSRTIFRLIKRYKDAGGTIISLVPHTSSGGDGKFRLDQKIEIIIQEAIDKVYLSKQQNTVKSVIIEVKRRCIEANLKPPSKNTIHRRVKDLSTKTVLEKRKGKKAAHLYTPNFGPSVTADYPLQAFMMDHTKVDLIVVDEFQRQPIGRPWLCVAIDIYSRCIAGFYLSFEAPSSVSVGLCLTHAVFAKDNYLKKFEINGTWPIFGKPNSIYVDQGAEFTSSALKRGCEQNGIKIFWRRVGAPHLHGIVERLHGNLMKAVHALPGTTFSNPVERGEYDSSAHAVLTIRELEKWLIHVIVGQYHLDIHSTIMEPPLSRFRRGLELLPSSPVQVTNEKSFLIDFLPIMKRTIQRHGFVIDHIHYFCNGLIPWINSKDKKESFIIRRDPRDLSRIYVLHPKETHYLEVPYRHMGRSSITIWEHKESLRRIREKGLSYYDESTIFKTISDMRMIVENATKETKQERKKKAIIENIREKMPHTNDKSKKIKEPPKYDLAEIKPFDEIEEW